MKKEWWKIADEWRKKHCPNEMCFKRKKERMKKKKILNEWNKDTVKILYEWNAF